MIKLQIIFYKILLIFLNPLNDDVKKIIYKLFNPLRILIESDYFLSKFPTTHLKILDASVKAEKQKRLQICENYLKIESDPGWSLSDQYLVVLDQLYDKVCVANYLFNWLSNLKLSDVNSLDRLYNVRVALQIIIFYFLNIKFYNKDQKISSENEKKLGEAVLSFLQYTINLTRILKDQATENNSTQPEECIYFRQAVIKQIRQNDMYLKGMALLLLLRVEQATAIALEIADEAIEYQDHGILFGFISYIWEYRQQYCMEQADKITLKLIPHFMKGQFRENLLQSYICLNNVMRAFNSSGLINEAFNCIQELCCYVESNNINITNTNLFLRIKDLLQIWPFSEINTSVQARIKWRLSEFIHCSALAYILYKASHFFPQTPLGQIQRKRLIVINIIFVKNLTQGSFLNYRQTLYEESFSLKNRKLRTLSELRRLTSKKTLSVFTEAFTSSRKGKHTKLFSIEAIENLIQCTRKKAQEYFKNVKGKTKPTGDNTCASDAQISSANSLQN